ncbi:MAG: nucleotidyl transferase AbiEii/AbiGii toxin family protein [Candidatus Micrarchaeota archaeon]
MIDKDKLGQIAKLNNLRIWQQEKHYLQNLILETLADYPLVFKGGTYLWFYYNLPRFSEDLDFTMLSPIEDDLAKRVSENLKLFGVENTVKPICNSDVSLSFRISARGPLNTSIKDLCHVYVEISKREQVIEKPLALKLEADAYVLPVKIINGMTLDEIAAEKTRAILTRNAPRDVYDLYFLINSQQVKFKKELVAKKLEYYQIAFSQTLFNKKITEKQQAWKKELSGLIFAELPEFKIVEKTLIQWSKNNSFP